MKWKEAFFSLFGGGNRSAQIEKQKSNNNDKKKYLNQVEMN